jgi:twitching motility two-component system response regulator PilG
VLQSFEQQPTGTGGKAYNAPGCLPTHTERATMEQHSRPLRVMVVDDSKTIRHTAETFLEQAGCEVVTAVDGFDALTRLTDHYPKVVFIDVMMPRLDGYQTCQLIKQNARFVGTSVIMLSSREGLFDRARARAVGADRFLTKPFDRASLLAAIQAEVSEFVPAPPPPLNRAPFIQTNEDQHGSNPDHR